LRYAVSRKHFLCGCLDFTDPLEEEHLIVGYGYRSSMRLTRICAPPAAVIGGVLGDGAAMPRVTANGSNRHVFRIKP
jgi:hypothetical protein